MPDPDVSPSPDPPSVEVELQPARAPAFCAIVMLRGEHDLATISEIQGALVPLHGDVLVDLSDCSFMDSSVVSLIFRTQRALQRDGHRLELLVPPTNRTITRAVEIAGIDDVMPVRRSLDESDTR